MMNQVKTLAPLGAVAFTGAALAAAVTDGRSLPTRVIVGFLATTISVGLAAHFGLVKLGAAAAATK